MLFCRCGSVCFRDSPVWRKNIVKPVDRAHGIVIGAFGLRGNGAVVSKRGVQRFDFADARFPVSVILRHGAGLPSSGHVVFDRTHRSVVGAPGLRQPAAPVGRVGARNCAFAAAIRSGSSVRRNGEAIVQESRNAFGPAGMHAIFPSRRSADRTSAHDQERSLPWHQTDGQERT